jgi:hypothetical protein
VLDFFITWENMKSTRLPPIPLKVTPWGDELLKLVPETMIPEATRHMRNGLGCSGGEWPRTNASIKEIHDEAREAWIGILNALEIAYGACSLDRSKELFARIETSHFVVEVKRSDQLMALFFYMETILEDWRNYEQNG